MSKLWVQSDTETTVRYVKGLEADNARLRARLATKQEALVDLFNMIEEGLLVRDITGDNSADYHQNAIAFVMRLKNARAALAQEDK